jgi:hypothetical protein
MGDELPCKVIPARREAYVSHSEKEIKVNQFKVSSNNTYLYCRDSFLHYMYLDFGREKTVLGV